MTNETTPAEQVDQGPQPSGADLARVALQQARKVAKQHGVTPTPRRRSRAVRRDDGRDPKGFADVLRGLVADRGWLLQAAGGTVLDQWPAIAAAVAAPLAEHVQAVAFHADSGRLDLRPDSPAYATQLRLITPRIIDAANEAAGTNTVRSVRVLPAVGGTDARPPHAPATAAAPSPEPEVRTRETASAGFRQALAAHQEAKQDRPHIDPGIAAAHQRQTHALNAHRRAVFAAEEQRLLREAELEDSRHHGATRDASRARALARARAERAGLPTVTPAAAAAPPPVDASALPRTA